MDRSLLLGWGLALSDEDFACAVACLGVTRIPGDEQEHHSHLSITSFELDKIRAKSRPHQGGKDYVLVEWSFERFQKRLTRLKKNNAYDLSRLALLWRHFATYNPGLCIQLTSVSLSQPSTPLPAVVSLLMHPSVAVNGVSAALEVGGFVPDWNWPMNLAAQAEALGEDEIKPLQKLWPSRNLVAAASLTRETAHGEILILRGTAREALRELLILPYEVTASLVILIGSNDESWIRTAPLLRAITTETQAGGLLLWSTISERSLSERINLLIEQLSHNLPLDVALLRAFGQNAGIALLSNELFKAAALPNAARKIVQRMVELPASVQFDVPKESVELLKSPSALDAAQTGKKGQFMRILTRYAENIAFDHESDGASGLSELHRAVASHRTEYADQAEHRFIQAQLWRPILTGYMVRERQHLEVGVNYILKVRVGRPGEDWLASETPFPQEKLDWKRDRYRIQVIFTEAHQLVRPLTGILELPRRGDSDYVEFLFSPREAGDFLGRITLVYRGRVLQTALLYAQVYDSTTKHNAKGKEEINLKAEALVRACWSDLDSRRSFDLAIVVNKSSRGKPTMTWIGKQGVFIYDLDNVKTQMAEINALLSDVAHDKQYSQGFRTPKNVALLRDLATQGEIMFSNLELTDHNFLKSEYLQIVSMKADALLPLEFVYEYPSPDLNAKLCVNAEEALTTGKCKGCKPIDAPAPHFCPLGFWGISKVIERHMYLEDDPQELGQRGAIAHVAFEPHLKKSELSLQGRSILASSKNVNKSDQKRVAKTLESLWSGGVEVVKDWKQWKSEVKKLLPPLILMLPHSTGSGSTLSLEIGGEFLLSRFINYEYFSNVNKKLPIVCLIGCDTANTASPDDYSTHVRRFRQANAAIVLSTISTVLGEHAARVGESLVYELLTAAETAAPQRFGEVLRSVKRKALLNGLPMALCLVAFGDADWILVKEL